MLAVVGGCVRLYVAFVWLPNFVCLFVVVVVVLFPLRGVPDVMFSAMGVFHGGLLPGRLPSCHSGI